VPYDGVGGAVTPAIGGRPATELLAALGTGRTEASAAVPVICGALLLPGVTPLGSFDEDREEPRGAGAAVLKRNPGWTRPSTSSTTSNPVPAMAARQARSPLPAATGAAPRWAPRLARGRPPAGATAGNRAVSGTVRRSSMTCSFSSAPARIGSSSGAQRAMHSARRFRQLSHWPTWRVTLNRRSAGNTTMARLSAPCVAASR
jgi:hypothetical protein